MKCLFYCVECLFLWYQREFYDKPVSAGVVRYNVFNKLDHHPFLFYSHPLFLVVDFVLAGTKDDVLGSVDLDMERKKIVIEIKSNDQGKFMTIVEYQNSQSRGRIIFSSEKAFEFSKILREFVAEYDRLPPLEEASTESERLKT